MKRFLSTRYNENSWHFALLLLRVAFGLLMLHYGFALLKDFAGTRQMNRLFGPPFDGLLVIFAEVFCAAMLVLGLFTRFALIPLIVAMVVAFFKVHHTRVYETHHSEMAVVFLAVFLTLLFTGPGKYSVDKMIAK
jgi:putative oxidoreductase